jgi:hypothetical protein
VDHQPDLAWEVVGQEVSPSVFLLIVEDCFNPAMALNMAR